MSRFKYHFLLGSFLLVFMGAMLKLEGYSNYTGSMIAGMINFFVFLYLLTIEAKTKKAIK